MVCHWKGYIAGRITGTGHTQACSKRPLQSDHFGVNRRAGADLSYGTVAETLLETAHRSVVFVEI